MARIIYSDIVSSIKGSIGGLTFNNNKAGPGVRLRPVNKFAPTVVQNEYKSQYIYLSGVWNSFSTAQKDDWNASVVGETFLNAWGEAKIWSGFNRFLSVNIGRLLLGLSIIEDSTSVDTPASPAVNGFTVNGSVIQVSFSSTSPYSYVYYMFYMSPPNRLAYNKQRTQLRLIHAQAMSGATSIRSCAISSRRP